jgi:hypothetical protein
MTSTTDAGSAAAVPKAVPIGTAPPPAFALRPLPGGFGAEVVGLAARDVDDASFPSAGSITFTVKHPAGTATARLL